MDTTLIEKLINSQPNENLVLEETESIFQTDDIQVEGKSIAYLRLAPKPKIEFHFIPYKQLGLNIFDVVWGNHEQQSLIYQHSNLETAVYLSKTTEDGFILTPQKQRIIKKEFDNPNTLVLGLINYWDFHGQPKRLHKLEPLINDPDKIFLEDGEFSILIESLPDLKEKIITLKSVGGYAITHLVIIKKRNEKEFTSEKEAYEIIDTLIDFLSFSSGTWVTPVYELGFSANDNKSWECWRIGKSHAWKNTLGWTDEHNARNTLPKAFPLFMKAYNSPSKNIIRSAINWYLLSNIQTVLDGSLVLANIALESLAWSQLVDKGKLSKNGFKRLDTSDLFRLLISECGLPTDIPNELPGLQRIGKELNFDGPEIVVQKRNATVHPTHSQKEKLSSITFGTWNLCMWYLELVILSILGYDGHYYKRLKISGWKGEKEIVPWAENDGI